MSDDNTVRSGVSLFERLWCGLVITLSRASLALLLSLGLQVGCEAPGPQTFESTLEPLPRSAWPFTTFELREASHTEFPGWTDDKSAYLPTYYSAKSFATTENVLGLICQRGRVWVVLDDAGTRALAIQTRSNPAGESIPIIALLLDGKLLTTSGVPEPINNGHVPLMGTACKDGKVTTGVSEEELYPSGGVTTPKTYKPKSKMQPLGTRPSDALGK